MPYSFGGDVGKDPEDWKVNFKRNPELNSHRREPIPIDISSGVADGKKAAEYTDYSFEFQPYEDKGSDPSGTLLPQDKSEDAISVRVSYSRDPATNSINIHIETDENYYDIRLSKVDELSIGNLLYRAKQALKIIHAVGANEEESFRFKVNQGAVNRESEELKAKWDERKGLTHVRRKHPSDPQSLETLVKNVSGRILKSDKELEPTIYPDSTMHIHPLEHGSFLTPFPSPRSTDALLSPRSTSTLSTSRSVDEDEDDEPSVEPLGTPRSSRSMSFGGGQRPLGHPDALGIVDETERANQFEAIQKAFDELKSSEKNDEDIISGLNALLRELEGLGEIDGKDELKEQIQSLIQEKEKVVKKAKLANEAAKKNELQGQIEALKANSPLDLTKVKENIQKLIEIDKNLSTSGIDPTDQNELKEEITQAIQLNIQNIKGSDDTLVSLKGHIEGLIEIHKGIDRSIIQEKNERLKEVKQKLEEAVNTLSGKKSETRYEEVVGGVKSKLDSIGINTEKLNEALESNSDRSFEVEEHEVTGLTKALKDIERLKGKAEGLSSKSEASPKEVQELLEGYVAVKKAFESFSTSEETITKETKDLVEAINDAINAQKDKLTTAGFKIEDLKDLREVLGYIESNMISLEKLNESLNAYKEGLEKIIKDIEKKIKEATIKIQRIGRGKIGRIRASEERTNRQEAAAKNKLLEEYNRIESSSDLNGYTKIEDGKEAEKNALLEAWTEDQRKFLNNIKTSKNSIVQELKLLKSKIQYLNKKGIDTNDIPLGTEIECLHDRVIEKESTLKALHETLKEGLEDKSLDNYWIEVETLKEGYKGYVDKVKNASEQLMKHAFPDKSTTRNLNLETLFGVKDGLFSNLTKEGLKEKIKTKKTEYHLVDLTIQLQCPQMKLEKLSKLKRDYDSLESIKEEDIQKYLVDIAILYTNERQELYNLNIQRVAEYALTNQPIEYGKIPSEISEFLEDLEKKYNDFIEKYWNDIGGDAVKDSPRKGLKECAQSLGITGGEELFKGALKARILETIKSEIESKVGREHEEINKIKTWLDQQKGVTHSGIKAEVVSRLTEIYQDKSIELTSDSTLDALKATASSNSEISDKFGILKKGLTEMFPSLRAREREIVDNELEKAFKLLEGMDGEYPGKIKGKLGELKAEFDNIKKSSRTSPSKILGLLTSINKELKEYESITLSDDGDLLNREIYCDLSKSILEKFVDSYFSSFDSADHYTSLLYREEKMYQTFESINKMYSSTAYDSTKRYLKEAIKIAYNSLWIGNSFSIPEYLKGKKADLSNTQDSFRGLTFLEAMERYEGHLNGSGDTVNHQADCRLIRLYQSGKALGGQSLCERLTAIEEALSSPDYNDVNTQLETLITDVGDADTEVTLGDVKEIVEKSEYLKDSNKSFNTSLTDLIESFSSSEKEPHKTIINNLEKIGVLSSEEKSKILAETPKEKVQRVTTALNAFFNPQVNLSSSEDEEIGEVDLSSLTNTIESLKLGIIESLNPLDEEGKIEQLRNLIQGIFRSADGDPESFQFIIKDLEEISKKLSEEKNAKDLLTTHRIPISDKLNKIKNQINNKTKHDLLIASFKRDLFLGNNNNPDEKLYPELFRRFLFGYKAEGEELEISFQILIKAYIDEKVKGLSGEDPVKGIQDINKEVREILEKVILGERDSKKYGENLQQYFENIHTELSEYIKSKHLALITSDTSSKPTLYSKLKEVAIQFDQDDKFPEQRKEIQVYMRYRKGALKSMVDPIAMCLKYQKTDSYPYAQKEALKEIRLKLIADGILKYSDPYPTIELLADILREEILSGNAEVLEALGGSENKPDEFIERMIDLFESMSKKCLLSHHESQVGVLKRLDEYEPSLNTASRGAALQKTAASVFNPDSNFEVTWDEFSGCRVKFEGLELSFLYEDRLWKTNINDSTYIIDPSVLIDYPDLDVGLKSWLPLRDEKSKKAVFIEINADRFALHEVNPQDRTKLIPYRTSSEPLSSENLTTYTNPSSVKLDYHGRLSLSSLQEKLGKNPFADDTTATNPFMKIPEGIIPQEKSTEGKASYTGLHLEHKRQRISQYNREMEEDSKQTKLYKDGQIPKDSASSSGTVSKKKEVLKGVKVQREKIEDIEKYCRDVQVEVVKMQGSLEEEVEKAQLPDVKSLQDLINIWSRGQLPKRWIVGGELIDLDEEGQKALFNKVARYIFLKNFENSLKPFLSKMKGIKAQAQALQDEIIQEINTKRNYSKYENEIAQHNRNYGNLLNDISMTLNQFNPAQTTMTAASIATTVFELYEGIQLTKSQRTNFVDKLFGDLEKNWQNRGIIGKKSAKIGSFHPIFNLGTGYGKTTMIKCMADFVLRKLDESNNGKGDRVCVIMAPDDNQGDLNAQVSQFFKGVYRKDVVKLDFSKHSNTTDITEFWTDEGKLEKVKKQLEKASESGNRQPICMSSKDFICLKAAIVAMNQDKIKYQNQLVVLMDIYDRLVQGVHIFDEWDTQYSPSEHETTLLNEHVKKISEALLGAGHSIDFDPEIAQKVLMTSSDDSIFLSATIGPPVSAALVTDSEDVAVALAKMVVDTKTTDGRHHQWMRDMDVEVGKADETEETILLNWASKELSRNVKSSWIYQTSTPDSDDTTKKKEKVKYLYDETKKQFTKQIEERIKLLPSDFQKLVNDSFDFDKIHNPNTPEFNTWNTLVGKAKDEEQKKLVKAISYLVSKSKNFKIVYRSEDPVDKKLTYFEYDGSHRKIGYEGVEKYRSTGARDICYYLSRRDEQGVNVPQGVDEDLGSNKGLHTMVTFDILDSKREAQRKGRARLTHLGQKHVTLLTNERERYLKAMHQEGIQEDMPPRSSTIADSTVMKAALVREMLDNDISLEYAEHDELAIKGIVQKEKERSSREERMGAKAAGELAVSLDTSEIEGLDILHLTDEEVEKYCKKAILQQGIKKTPAKGGKRVNTKEIAKIPVDPTPTEIKEEDIHFHRINELLLKKYKMVPISYANKDAIIKAIKESITSYENQFEKEIKLQIDKGASANKGDQYKHQRDQFIKSLDKQIGAAKELITDYKSLNISSVDITNSYNSLKASIQKKLKRESSLSEKTYKDAIAEMSKSEAETHLENCKKLLKAIYEKPFLDIDLSINDDSSFLEEIKKRKEILNFCIKNIELAEQNINLHQYLEELDNQSYKDNSFTSSRGDKSEVDFKSPQYLIMLCYKHFKVEKQTFNDNETDLEKINLKRLKNCFENSEKISSLWFLAKPNLIKKLVREIICGEKGFTSLQTELEKNLKPTILESIKKHQSKHTQGTKSIVAEKYGKIRRELKSIPIDKMFGGVGSFFQPDGHPLEDEDKKDKEKGYGNRSKKACTLKEPIPLALSFDISTYEKKHKEISDRVMTDTSAQAQSEKLKILNANIPGIRNLAQEARSIQKRREQVQASLTSVDR